MTEKPKTSFLWGVHYFRGVAILIIMTVHVWVNPLTARNAEKTDWIGIIRESLFDGSTVYFILISGFLFQYLSKKFQLRRYYTNKVRYIIVPYIILTAIYFAFYAFVGAETMSVLEYFEALPGILGQGIGPMWYIPFISILFLLSPLILYIPEKARIKIFPFLMLLPLLGTRTDVDITLGQYIYFTPIYLFGVYTCLKFDYLMNLVERNKTIILVLLIIMTIIIFGAWYTGMNETYLHPYLAILFVRNILACFYILFWLEKGRDNYKYWLDKIAVYSFALFFTHSFLHTKFTSRILYAVADSFGDIGMLFISTLYVPVFIIINLHLCILAKKVLGKASRYVIGV